MWSEELELAPPPRPVSLGATLEVLLGGLGLQVGCALLVVGGLFAWVFVAQSDLFDLLRFAGPLERAQGTVLRVEGTGATVNEQVVRAVQYRFQDPQGAQREAVSYQTGATLTAGAPVTVEFPAGDPGTSRIEGMRRAEFPPAVAFVLLFPLGGLIPALLSLRGGLRRAALLRHGRRAEGKLIGKEPTNTTINDRPVMRLTFAFQDDEGQEHTVEARSHRPEGLEDELSERILYDPARPAQATLVDALPGAGQSTPLGGWEAYSARGPLLKLLLPLLALLVNGAGLLLAAAG